MRHADRSCKAPAWAGARGRVAFAGGGRCSVRTKRRLSRRSSDPLSSKADLVRAYLEARHEEWLALYRRRLESARDPREAVLAVFDAYTDHAALAYQHGFRGCGLLNAAAELPAGDPGRAVVRAHKEEVEGLLAGHLEGLLPGRPDQARATAEHLAFLLEGATARAGLEGNDARLRHARQIASGLLETL